MPNDYPRNLEVKVALSTMNIGSILRPIRNPALSPSHKNVVASEGQFAREFPVLNTARCDASAAAVPASSGSRGHNFTA